MAITVVSSRTKYIGATADTKPTFATHNTLPGATFYDYQTGILYITRDGTNWVEKNTVISGVCKTISVTKALAAAAGYTAGDVLSEHATTGTVWTFSSIFC